MLYANSLQDLISTSVPLFSAIFRARNPWERFGSAEPYEKASRLLETSLASSGMGRQMGRTSRADSNDFNWFLLPPVPWFLFSRTEGSE